jgi:large subunit ribosomal protein L28
VCYIRYLRGHAGRVPHWRITMECPVTGIKTRFGNRVSHANNKTRRTWEPNMQTKRFWIPSENRYIRLTLSTQGIKKIDKVGIEAVLADMKKRGVKY